MWDERHPRYAAMLSFAKTHNDYADYAPLVDRMDAEAMANLGLTLCHQADRLMIAYLKRKEKEFVEQGGIRERMTAARLGYRNSQREALDAAHAEISALREENAQLKQRITQLEAKIQELGNYRKG